MSNLTRRSLVAALPFTALAAPATALAAAPTAPEAELLRLGEEFSAAWADEGETVRQLNQAPPEQDCDPLYAAHEARYAVTNSIVDKIEALQATTLAGLIVKARASTGATAANRSTKRFSTTIRRRTAGSRPASSGISWRSGSGSPERAHPPVPDHPRAAAGRR